MNDEETLVIGIVAGEVSGDSLGADFMRQMNQLSDNVRWVGVGGRQMQAQGLDSLFDMSRLSVMGLVEVIKHLPDLFRARDELLELFEAEQIDGFIGIDAPDFNLRLGKILKKRHVFCVQYVSPSIWAWREGRIHGIKEATDLVLCLFPFEVSVYKKYQHPAVCVGHPLLHKMDEQLRHLDTAEQRKERICQSTMMLDYFAKRQHATSHIVCMMPGSRHGEVQAILPLMLDSVEALLQRDDELCFIIPAINQDIQQQIQHMIDTRSESVKQAVGVLYDETKTNLSQQLMAMSDLILLASGTATLEAMLLHRPMVVVYQLNTITYHIAKYLVKTPYVALPNILADKEIVPELIQKDASAKNIAREVWQTLHTRAYDEQVYHLQQTSQTLYQQSNENPAHAFVEQFTLGFKHL